MANGNEAGFDNFRQIVYGICAAATMAYAAWAGVQINSVNDRLTRIETRMDENRNERVTQNDFINKRLERLESKNGDRE